MFDLVPFKRRNDLAHKGDYFNHLLDSFFHDDFLAPFKGLTADFDSFQVDLKEDSEAYVIEADLPGVKKEDINLDYRNNYLMISAKRETSAETKDSEHNYVRRERSFGQFQRTFYMDNVFPDQINAEFQDGVLKIRLPKKEKTPLVTHTIPIR